MATGILRLLIVVIAVMLDINLAIQFADNMLFFRVGKIVAGGVPKEIINEKLLEEVFQVRSTVINNPVSGNPLVIFDNSMG
jgi:iron complex transport system ATP-binding protein